ncbi:cupin domain-containing protein [Hymenobacter sp. YC55]|uniref:cupin domain-containing protein n=1 Tax=Hymenobacter sp. YC55 TaxID=3034019 RepID=UPI0023F6FE84|nr:cupin domain-containing protein [Hymenobacter sp. YC55]MDF7814872.1 cupin domain-containing protein [Hymenobacter sp. YC55]
MQTTFPQTLVAEIGELRAYQGGYFRVLVTPQQTDNNFSLLELTLPRGAEPPRHVHTHEDETFYLLEGEITFHIGADTVVAQAGDTVFAPRKVPHNFVLASPEARFLVLLTPGQFMGHFLEYSQPLATVGPVTPPQGPPPADVILGMVRSLHEQYGVLFI